MKGIPSKRSLRFLEKEKLSARVFVCSHGFVWNAERIKFAECFGHVVDLESQMAQAGGFGMRRSGWWRGEGEQLNHVVLAKGEVGFIRLPLGAVVFRKNAQAEHASVEIEAPRVVGANDGDVVDFVQM